MPLTFTWRTRLFGLGGAIVGILLAVQIAQGEFMLPSLMAAAAFAFGLARFQPHSLPTLLLGVVLIGYIVGNRGFAQISALGNFPLFPAELVLLVAGVCFVVHCAVQRRLPVERDALNVAILGWMIVSSVRLPQDVRSFGFVALRDYATVYYASFFFLAQWIAADGQSRAFLWRCTLAASGSLLVTFPLFDFFPNVFLDWLTVRGAPIIHYKGDLVGTSMAVGAVLCFARFEERRAWGWLVLSLALSAAVLTTNNRASMLALVVAAGLLAVAGRWRFAVVQGSTGIAVAVVIVAAAYWKNIPLSQTPLYGMFERVVSIADPRGQRVYSGQETFNKGDNNLFRAVWWEVAINETVDQGPWLGVGWGYDLAEPFVRVYYPDAGDDFVTRSPHNVLITLFARTGVVGLLPFLLILVIIARRSWQAARCAAFGTAALWCACCAILTSACLGVVLEGPMGAVVFWTLLGWGTAELRAAEGGAEPMDADIAASAPSAALEADAPPATRAQP
jgi:O-antigen ligase